MTADKINTPLISIVIPVKNGASTIKECLDSIFAQKVDASLDVVVIDSGSTDATLEIAKQYPVRILAIDPADFNHGDTRNLGVEQARGEYTVFTVQDAKASGNNWLKTMLVHFETPRVSAVCGQQIVEKSPDRNPLQWFKPASKARVRQLYFEDFTALNGREQLEHCHWDNVNAMYRTAVLKEIPFRHAAFAEDARWAKDALTSRKTLVYDYNARVYHYHHQSFRFYFRRNYIIRYFSYQDFNHFKSNSFLPLSLTKIAYRSMKLQLSVREKIKWALYNIKLELARTSVTVLFWSLIKIGGAAGADKGLKLFCNTIPQGKQSR